MCYEIFLTSIIYLHDIYLPNKKQTFGFTFRYVSHPTSPLSRVIAIHSYWSFGLIYICKLL